MKLILILLANKADEGFSSLMPEFGTGRSTVLRALNDLETRGVLTRQPQFHERVAQRSSRSYLNHPDAPDLSSRPNAGFLVPIERRQAPTWPMTSTAASTKSMSVADAAK